MFGVVPKPLWERRIPADERNRIPLALRCLLVEAPEALVLIDTGIGNKEDERFRSIYGVENEGDPTRLEDAIRAAGFQPSDVDIVLLTHLHFDHVGGATRLDAGGRVVPSFPGARHVVQRGRTRLRRLAQRARAGLVPGAESGPHHRGRALVPRGGRDRDHPGGAGPPHPGAHAASPERPPGHGRRGGLLPGGPLPHHGPPAAPLDHGLRPGAPGDAGNEARPVERAQAEDWLLVFEHDVETPWGWLDEAGKGLRP
jgi:hypothetical protein